MIGSGRRVNAKWERERAAACLAQAEIHVRRLRQFLTPGLVDSVASMLESDIESAQERVQWLRAREEDEAA